MKKIQVNIPRNEYEIIIDKGLFSKFGVCIKDIYEGDKLFIVTDKNLYKIYGDKLIEVLENSNFSVKIHIIEPGESSKSMVELEKIYEAMVEFNITRADMIVAFGGGVVGDLTGFAASTFLRGVPFIQIPTSLLAQVDSSVGGKVAVDLESGKNLVGSFYHPKSVLMDTELLKTLPSRFLSDGMAEVIKYGGIKDIELFNKLLNFKDTEELLLNIEDVIYTCCSIKRDIVERDELDLGERMILNYGHTIGHGIEQFYNYKKYTHGEGVAVGMYWITKKSEALGITEKGTTEKLKVILEKYNLQYEIPALKSEDIIEIIALDKKKSRNTISLILLEALGKGFIKKINFQNIREYI